MFESFAMFYFELTDVMWFGFVGIWLEDGLGGEFGDFLVE